MTGVNRCPRCHAYINISETSCHDCGQDLKNTPTFTGEFFDKVPQMPKPKRPLPGKNVRLNDSKKEVIYNSKTNKYHYAIDNSEESDIDAIERRKKDCPDCPEIKGRDIKSKEFKQIVMPVRSPLSKKIKPIMMPARCPPSDEFDDKSKDARWGKQVAETWKDLAAGR